MSQKGIQKKGNEMKIALIEKIKKRRLKAIDFDIDEKSKDVNTVIWEMEQLYQLIIESSDNINNSNNQLAWGTSVEDQRSAVRDIDSIFAGILEEQINEKNVRKENKEDLDEEIDGILAIVKNNSHNIEIEIDPTNIINIKVSKDNKILFEKLLENHKILNEKLNSYIEKYIQFLISTEFMDQQLMSSCLGRALLIKSTIDKANEKFNKLGVHSIPEGLDSDEDSESEFEDVEFGNLESIKNKTDLNVQFEGWESKSEESDIDDKNIQVGHQLPTFNDKSKPKKSAYSEKYRLGVEKELADISSTDNTDHISNWKDLQKRNLIVMDEDVKSKKRKLRDNTIENSKPIDEKESEKKTKGRSTNKKSKVSVLSKLRRSLKK
ncbi:hypothetical protein BB558_001995 [Smittium angustum]|uniref:Uncharacterized protein n=1 Tax=Smittium angustum TaxID=133377 RepID=A0A2U1JA39_SMIAN|nr:hypothetical protein BB558_001995 [Smittium angustum]